MWETDKTSLGRAGQSSATAGLLRGSMVFCCNESILFEKKIVGHVTVVGYMTVCLGWWPSGVSENKLFHCLEGPCHVWKTFDML